MARLRVSEPFGLASRNLFVLAGDVIDRHIAPGMKVEIPLDASTTLTAPIYAVEYIRRSSSRQEVGLCIKCEDSDELEVWKGLNISSEVVDVSA